MIKYCLDQMDLNILAIIIMVIKPKLLIKVDTPNTHLLNKTQHNSQITNTHPITIATPCKPRVIWIPQTSAEQAPELLTIIKIKQIIITIDQWSSPHIIIWIKPGNNLIHSQIINSQIKVICPVTHITLIIKQGNTHMRGKEKVALIRMQIITIVTLRTGLVHIKWIIMKKVIGNNRMIWKNWLNLTHIHIHCKILSINNHHRKNSVREIVIDNLTVIKRKTSRNNNKTNTIITLKKRKIQNWVTIHLPKNFKIWKLIITIIIII